MFCDSQRNILKENDIVKFPKLADTYQRIADEGPDVFYNGSMAQSIVEDIQAAGRVLFFFTDRIKSLTTATFEHFSPGFKLTLTCVLVPGGIITPDDLLEYQPVLNENPLRLNVGEYTMHVPDAPSSGPVLALILNIVDGEQAGQVLVQPCRRKGCQVSPGRPLNVSPPDFGREHGAATLLAKLNSPSAAHLFSQGVFSHALNKKQHH